MLIAIKIQSLSYQYEKQSKKVIENLNLEIAQGERFGIFGPNGAGKTTLMNLMTGILNYKTGSIQLNDLEINKHYWETRKLFGFVPQDFSFYHELTPVENLSFFGAWSGLKSAEIKKRTDELLEVMALTESRNKPVKQFSGGMKRRVNLAIAVMHEPQLLFLDEPTVGVDVQTRHAIVGYLKELNQKGTTLIYTSHQLKEAEDLCTRIALIDEGKIIENDTLDNLLKEHKQDGLEGLFLQLTGRAYRD